MQKQRTMSKLYSVEELHNGAITEIPHTSGVYFVFMPENFVINIKEKTEGFPLTSKGKPSSYPVQKLLKKAEQYSKPVDPKSHPLYIGKAKDLYRRIEQYIAYRYHSPNLFPHDGGRAIWQLDKSERLLFRYVECHEGEDCRELERQLLCEYKERHGEYPFANWKA